VCLSAGVGCGAREAGCYAEKGVVRAPGLQPLLDGRLLPGLWCGCSRTPIKDQVSDASLPGF
jgi:hypothetical protein